MKADLIEAEWKSGDVCAWQVLHVVTRDFRGRLRPFGVQLK